MGKAGDVVGGKYRLVHPLGIGGMGTVFRAEHVALQQQVAVKLLDARGPQADRAVKRFQREAQIAASIRHRNIVYISDFGADGGAPYLVMELLNGVPLSERLVVGEPLSVGAFLQLMDETLQGLCAVHAAGVVHRDLKPENIFLVREPNDTFFPKLLDFGVSRSTERNAGHTITREGIVMGTPEYVSPEQARGRMADHRSDIYSLGVVIYEALAGRLPFQADNAADLIVAVLNAVPLPLYSLRPDLGQPFSDLVHKTMARKPEDRFQSTEEMRNALFALLDAHPEIESLSLPHRFVTPSSVSRSLPPPSLFPSPVSYGTPGAQGDSLRPTAALPAMLVPARKQVMALSAGALALILSVLGIAFITAGGQPRQPARAEGSKEPMESAQALATPEPSVPETIVVELHGLPAEAQVKVDGKDVSELPLRLSRNSGTHQIGIEAPGMLSWMVTHDAAGDGRYAVVLEPDPKLSRVRAPKRAAKSKAGLLRRPDF